MYKPSGSEKFETLDDIVPVADAGSDRAQVVANEHTVTLKYVDSDQKPVEVEFSGATVHMFGYPNGEILSAHPLYKKGLEHYGAFEVINSGWIKDLERMNRAHPHHDKERFLSNKHHFIFSFHDSTFECIAESLGVITESDT